MNKVFLSGTVESGPKLRLETGKPDQATFQLSAWHRAENGQWRREAYTVCCQNKRAYWAMVNIEAGQRIAVEGTLLGAGQVKIAALEIEYTSGRKRENGYTEDTQCGTTQGTTDDDADEGCEKEEPMETAEQAKELGEAQTEAQTPTPGKAQSNDGIDPRQLKWYDVGKKYGRTEASRARSAQGWNAAPGGKDWSKDGRFSRMGKKLLSMVLALVMALGMAVCGEAEDAMPEGERTEGVQEELHTIWGIPWGSSEDEVIRLAKKNAGFTISQHEDQEDETWSSGAIYTGFPNFKERLFVAPVFWFQKNQGLTDIMMDSHVSFKLPLTREEASEVVIGFLKKIIDRLIHDYGPATAGILKIKTDKAKQMSYQILNKQKDIDLTSVLNALNENVIVSTQLVWTNVEFEMSYTYTTEAPQMGSYVWFSNKAIELKVDQENLLVYPQ